MGFLQNGKWIEQQSGATSKDGRFIRPDTQFRNWVTRDGSPGPSGIGGFRAEPGRYHLYVSYACPWAHRALVFRTLKGLEDLISLSVVHWYLGAKGWTFDDCAGVIPDTVNHAQCLHEIYVAAERRYSGRVSVPVLWDRQTRTIVSNESAEIIRMFNSAFDDVGATPGDYYPGALRAEIDRLNERIYSALNNGVYKAGFARTQRAYEDAVVPLFETLDWLEDRLAGRRFLVGAEVTEADWRLFTTLVRFDPVYFGHFKCNLKRVCDYPNLFGYLRDLYQHPGIAETVDFDHIKRHYYESHESINPTRIVPLGPEIDHSQPHDRDRLG